MMANFSLLILNAIYVAIVQGLYSNLLHVLMYSHQLVVVITLHDISQAIAILYH